jgi:DNA-binding CsgD family transcriptional regulator
VLALLDSPVAGEREAALARATAILQAEGKSFLDLGALFASVVAAPVATVWQPPSYADFCARQDEEEVRNPGHTARQAAAAAEERRREAEYRAAVIAKYGSESAALEPDEWERAMDARLAPLIRDVMRQGASGASYEMTTLDGWHTYDEEDPPEHVAAAIKAAWPFPETIPAAKVEADYWSERSLERLAMSDDLAHCSLSLASDARRRLVDQALQTGLRGQSLFDVLIRQRMIIEAEVVPGQNELMAILADLRHLLKLGRPTAPIQNGHLASATARRAEVVRLLSSLDTRSLSDREIARRVGVSPMTVGNIRRRMAAEALAKAGAE